VLLDDGVQRDWGGGGYRPAHTTKCSTACTGQQTEVADGGWSGEGGGGCSTLECKAAHWSAHTVTHRAQHPAPPPPHQTHTTTTAATTAMQHTHTHTHTHNAGHHDRVCALAQRVPHKTAHIRIHTPLDCISQTTHPRTCTYTGCGDVIQHQATHITGHHHGADKVQTTPYTHPPKSKGV
jgi:hypothetical protein